MKTEQEVLWFDLSEMEPTHPMYEKLKELNEKKIVDTVSVVEPHNPEYESMNENYQIERMKEERRKYYRNLNKSEN